MEIPAERTRAFDPIFLDVTSDFPLCQACMASIAFVRAVCKTGMMPNSKGTEYPARIPMPIVRGEIDRVTIKSKPKNRLGKPDLFKTSTAT